MKASEWFHAVRMAFWIVLAPVVLLTPLREAVWLVILLSLYANFASDLTALQAARSERHLGDA